jgi:hypothetical protein
MYLKRERWFSFSKSKVVNADNEILSLPTNLLVQNPRSTADYAYHIYYFGLAFEFELSMKIASQKSS